MEEYKCDYCPRSFDTEEAAEEHEADCAAEIAHLSGSVPVAAAAPIVFPLSLCVARSCRMCRLTSAAVATKQPAHRMTAGKQCPLDEPNEEPHQRTKSGKR